MTDNPQGVSDEADAGAVEMVGRGRWWLRCLEMTHALPERL